MSEVLPDPVPQEFPALTRSHLTIAGHDDRLVRVFSHGGSHPTTWNAPRHYGPLATGRFDHHPNGAPSYHAAHSVWYAALEIADDNNGLHTALAERFQDTRTVPLSPGFSSLVICQPARTLRLLNLDSRWITQAGGNAAITSGPRIQSRTWAREIRRHYAELDGLVWSSSVHPPGKAIVLWDHDSDTLAPFADLISPLDGLARVLVPVIDDLGYMFSTKT